MTKEEKQSPLTNQLKNKISTTINDDKTPSSKWNLKNSEIRPKLMIMMRNDF